VVDRALDGLIAPFAQRTAARALVTLPRGSIVATPDAPAIRLFLHWMEEGPRVDLDLSVAFFDADWTHRGTCDYTSLRFGPEVGDGRSAAVHSGDLTSAPPPLGASEFLDLEVATLAESGLRYAVTAVFSYNNIPFENMAEAFAGVMVRPDDPQDGPVFDARTVEQRFDLAGRSRACLPFLLDLRERSMRWLDVAQGVTGTNHAVHRHHDAMALLGAALDELYRGGARVNLGELARWHAAARADRVTVRAPNGSIAHLIRSSGEDAAAFARRIQDGPPDETGATWGAVPASTGPVELAYLLRGDLPVADGASVYTLHPGHLTSERAEFLAAADLVSQLEPQDRAALVLPA
jgi:hypothetical protein